MHVSSLFYFIFLLYYLETCHRHVSGIFFFFYSTTTRAQDMCLKPFFIFSYYTTLRHISSIFISNFFTIQHRGLRHMSQAPGVFYFISCMYQGPRHILKSCFYYIVYFIYITSHVFKAECVLDSTI